MTETTLTLDPVDVLCREDQPAHFLWRGRLYMVRDVLGHWAEPGDGLAPTASLSGGQQVWRVGASAGRSAAPGVFELRLDQSDGQWSLARLDPPDPDHDRQVGIDGERSGAGQPGGDHRGGEGAFSPSTGSLRSE